MGEGEDKIKKTRAETRRKRRPQNTDEDNKGKNMKLNKESEYLDPPAASGTRHPRVSGDEGSSGNYIRRQVTTSGVVGNRVDVHTCATNSNHSSVPSLIHLFV